MRIGLIIVDKWIKLVSDSSPLCWEFTGLVCSLAKVCCLRFHWRWKGKDSGFARDDLSLLSLRVNRWSILLRPWQTCRAIETWIDRKGIVNYILWSNKPKCEINCAKPRVLCGPFCTSLGEGGKRRKRYLLMRWIETCLRRRRSNLSFYPTACISTRSRLDRVVASSAPNQSFNLPSVWCTSLTLHLLTMRDQQ